MFTLPPDFAMDVAQTEYYTSSIVPTLQRGNAAQDASASTYVLLIEGETTNAPRVLHEIFVRYY